MLKINLNFNQKIQKNLENIWENLGSYEKTFHAKLVKNLFEN